MFYFYFYLFILVEKLSYDIGAALIPRVVDVHVV